MGAFYSPGRQEQRHRNERRESALRAFEAGASRVRKVEETDRSRHERTWPGNSCSRTLSRVSPSLRPALGSLAVLVLSACAEAPEQERPAPVLLLAVDGFEWDLALPLLRAGQLPHLAALMERGSYGELETLEPTLSPVIWTTVATGKGLAQHGIDHFVRESDVPGAAPRLLTNADRRTKAIWNIASDAGRRVAAVGWWMTYPVERVNGVMVAQTNSLEHLFDPSGRHVAKGGLVDGVSRQVFPPARHDELLAILAEVDASLDTRLERDFGSFRHALPPLEEKLWTNCRWSLRADLTYLEIAKLLLDEPDPYDLVAVYLGATDVVGHRFYRYHAPELYGVRPAQEQLADLGGVLEHAYMFLDSALGELVERAEPGTRVLLVSDHGMQPVGRTNRFRAEDPAPALNSAHHLDAPPGVFVAAGADLLRRGSATRLARLEREELASSGSVFDLAPTVLALLDVPVGEDFEGRVLTQWIEPAFLDLHPPRSVPSHDTAEWLGARRALRGRGPDAAERLQQLEDLGYIGD